MASRKSAGFLLRLKRNEDQKYVKAYFKKYNPKRNDLKGWEFDWHARKLMESRIDALYACGDERIQGLLATRNMEDDDAVFVDLAESAPWNSRHNDSIAGQAYYGVGICLFAEAIRQSYELGYNGFVEFDSKTNLIEYYSRVLGAQQIGNTQRMFIDEAAAERLLYVIFGS